MLNKILTALFVLVLYSSVFADEDKVATVIILKGMAKAKLANGSLVDLKENTELPSGAIIQTAEKSFVKLIFIDRSTMNVGPNSQIAISSFPKNEAGIISLLKGQIRSKVTKDYMDMKDKSKSKLYIQTKTAAMGIRGTDFQVNYNPQNMNTSLITFEGKVILSEIDKHQRDDRFDQAKLERIVSNSSAVMVEKGHVSAVNLNLSQKAMIPTILGVKQIEALKSNETGIKETTQTEDKQFRNPIPPGVDGVAFSNVNKEAKLDLKSENTTGFFDSKTGSYKLPAGSIIDLKTVNIIPPPPNALFDNNTKTYTIPDTYGKIDKSSGEYIPPSGLQLGHDGKFYIAEPEARKAPGKEEKEKDKSKTEDSSKKEKGRDIASVNAAPVIEVPKLYEALPGAEAFTQIYSDNTTRGPSNFFAQPAPNLDAAIIDRKLSTESVKQTTTDQGTNFNSTKVRAIFRVN